MYDKAKKKVFKRDAIKRIMNKWIELLLGLILLIVPIVIALSYPAWGAATLAFLMGAVVVIVALIGLMFIMLGISDISS